MAEQTNSGAFSGVRHRLGLDGAVALSVVSRLWALAAGLVTTLLVAAFFPPELQGFHYTFLSVMSLQVFAELGLGTVVIAHAAHEWAALALDDTGRAVGDSHAKSRLASLAGFTASWYLVAGAAATVVLSLGGLLFFGSTHWDQWPLWGPPWLALCVATGLNLWLAHAWVLLEGCNQVSSVYGFRLTQAVASGLAAWLAIALGWGLWALPLMGLVSVVVSTGCLWGRHAAFFKDLLALRPLVPALRWRQDILPMQWRVALSWLSGYLAFSLFTPVLFHYQGAVTAGQMGMTWALINALTSVASGWIAPKAPRLSMLIAKQDYRELDRQFWHLLRAVVAIVSAGAVAIFAVILGLQAIHHPLAQRLLPPSAAGYLLVATLLQTTSLPMSAYLRAHRKEPLLALSVAQGLSTAIIVVVLGKHGSVEAVALGYLAVVAVAVPWAALVWQRSRLAWHKQA